MNEIIRTPNGWSGDDTNLANTYLNIANVLPVVQQWMKAHINNVKNGNGIITLGDIQEALKFLENNVNDRLRSSISNKVTISLTENINKAQQTKINEMRRIRLTESDLHRIVKESVNRVLNELSTPKIVKAHRAAMNGYKDEIKHGRYGDKRMRQMKAFNDEYNRRTNNCTQLPSDMTQDEFDNARRNNWA